MELPQPRPPESQDRKATHDFLSLYSSLTTHAQQDPTPSQGDYLKTYDFLQPFERVFKNGNATKEENKAVMEMASMEHLLPGGVGTYNISYFNRNVVLPEGNIFSRYDENSNGTSHGFTLWDESSVRTGKTWKENIAAQTHIMGGVNVVEGQWASSTEKPPQSSSNHKHTVTTFDSFSSSQPSSSLKNQSFMEMMTSTKDEEEDKFIIKKEHSSYPKGNFPVKIEPMIVDQKPITPRSKHSATEQRRRSKINDRFQKLREIIPNSDQKRDKASFLLEVIGYVQFLQEKVSRYESSYNVLNHETSKMIQWNNKQIAAEDLLHHQTQGAATDFGSATVCVRTCDEHRPGVSPKINGQRCQQPETTQYVRTSIAEAAASSRVSPMEDQELTVESDVIDISRIYSQELSSTLKQALRSSGVDLSQTSVSVQIDLGKRATTTKDDDVIGGLPRSQTATAGKGVGHGLKRLRNS